MLAEPHPLYTGVTNSDKILIVDGEAMPPIRFLTQKPSDADGNPRDQTYDAAEHMRYAATLGLPELTRRERPRLGRAVIVGGAPSIKDHLEEIRALSADPNNAVFAVNWSHTWLINNGIIPRGCVFFEIDAEPDSVLKNAHPDVTYLVCSHCDKKTFDELRGKKRVLWHTLPNSEAEEIVGEELFPNSHLCGGGIGTFTRTLTVALFLGYRHFDLFGCDSSFPEKGKTHVDGYETVMDPERDGFDVYAEDISTRVGDKQGDVRKFRTLGYLALQHEEFMLYCQTNHPYFSLRVHGDSLLGWSHRRVYPDQYE